jgi:hypothetical protein
MNFGAPTPVEVAIGGPDSRYSRVSTKLYTALAESRHCAISDRASPTISDLVNVDRSRCNLVSRWIRSAVRSPRDIVELVRRTNPADPRTALRFRCSKPTRMRNLDDLRACRDDNQMSHPLLGDVASIQNGTIVGEHDRLNGQRLVTLSANIFGEIRRVAARRRRHQARRRPARKTVGSANSPRCKRRFAISRADSSWRSL